MFCDFINQYGHHKMYWFVSSTKLSADWKCKDNVGTDVFKIKTRFSSSFLLSGSQATQATLKLSMYARVTLNSGLFGLQPHHPILGLQASITMFSLCGTKDQTQGLVHASKHSTN